MSYKDSTGFNPKTGGRYTKAIVVFGFSCPHPNPLPGGEGVAIPSPSGRGLG